MICRVYYLAASKIRSSLLILAAACAGCASLPPVSKVPECRRLDAAARNKIGPALKQAIELSLKLESQGTSDERVDALPEPSCPSALIFDIAHGYSCDTRWLSGVRVECTEDRLFVDDAYPSGRLPLSTELLNDVCHAARSPWLRKVDMETGVRMPTKTSNEVGGLIPPLGWDNSDWMSEINDATLGGSRKTDKVVAILDTEIVSHHEDLPSIERLKIRHRLNGRGQCQGNDCCEAAGDYTWSEDHATFVAGTIAAIRNQSSEDQTIDGLSEPAHMLAIDIFGTTNSCVLPTLMAAGLQCALDRGAKIINISAGDIATGSVPPDDLKHAMDNAAQSQALVVVAAGGIRGSVNLDTNRRWPASYNTDSSLVVGSVSIGSESRIEYSFGPKTVDLIVPISGTQVKSTYRCRSSGDACYAYYNGTSAAAAIVTGEAAALWGRPEFSNCNASQLRQILMKNAHAPNFPARWQISGLGGVLDLGFLGDNVLPDQCPPMVER